MRLNRRGAVLMALWFVGSVAVTASLAGCKKPKKEEDKKEGRLIPDSPLKERLA